MVFRKRNRQTKNIFLFVEVTHLHIYENDEGKYKCNFTYNNHDYKEFSITAPKFKLKNKKISKVALFLLVYLIHLI